MQMFFDLDFGQLNIVKEVYSVLVALTEGFFSCLSVLLTLTSFS